MATAFQGVFTGKDNETHDIIKWMAVISFVVGIALQIYQVVWKGSVFDLQTYGLGLGTLFVTVGAALKIKESTEPETKTS